MQELTFRNFFSDLIFHPEHAKPENQNKCLLISIFLGIASLGIIPVTIGIFWAGRSAVSWIKQMFSTEAKTHETAQKILNETKLKETETSSMQSIPTGFEQVCNPKLISKLNNLNLNLKQDEIFRFGIPHKTQTKPKVEGPISENKKILDGIYKNTGTARIISEISIYRNETNFYLCKQEDLTIEALLDLDWDKMYKC